jgi:CheY-like chemotaxis protein
MKDTKLVFMAYPSKLAAIQEARTLGASLFLAKPFKLRDIFNLFETSSNVSRTNDFLAGLDLNYISAERTDQNLSIPRSILLAEDNTVNQKLIQRTLERKNFRVRIANNGKEAVEAFKAQDFDLVLMDVQMPVMDGLSATKIIRDYERQINRRTPIVAMTAHAFQQTQDVCREAGMDYYFSKPISGKNLIEKIETILKRPQGI